LAAQNEAKYNLGAIYSRLLELPHIAQIILEHNLIPDSIKINLSQRTCSSAEQGNKINHVSLEYTQANFIILIAQ